MKLAPHIQKRFEDLLAQGKSLPVRETQMGRHVPSGEWKLWVASALNLLSYVFGENSVHFRQLSEVSDNFKGYVSNAESGVGVFEAAKRDVEAGVVGSIEQRITGELFSDFVVSAKTALAEGQKDVAAVLACAALEDTLKRFAALKGISVDNKTMDSVVGALKAAGLVSGAQKGLLDAMPRIRNAAMHADWKKISEPDVASVIGFTEQFLLTHLS
jgi:hypothetical protein